ncbi:MAG: nucleotidyltransferase family protein [Bacteroidota bacterium]
MKSTSLVGVLLAAGQARRMGQPKQLLDIDGEPLVVHTARKLLSIAPAIPIITVLGASAAAVRTVLRTLEMELIFHPQFANGMGTSIAAAVGHLSQQSRRLPDALLISVCDQPYLTTEVLETLIAAHRAQPEQIIVARYAVGYGVPVILPRRLFSVLQNMDGDKGARTLLRERTDELVFVDFERGHEDLDTPADYARFLQSQRG